MFVVLSQLHQNGHLLSAREFSAILACFGFSDSGLGSSWLIEIIKCQETKSADVVDATVDILERYNFKEYAGILKGTANKPCVN